MMNNIRIHIQRPNIYQKMSHLGVPMLIYRTETFQMTTTWDISSLAKEIRTERNTLSRIIPGTIEWSNFHLLAKYSRMMIMN